MFVTPSFKKSLIVEQFQGNYLKFSIVHIAALLYFSFFYPFCLFQSCGALGRSCAGLPKSLSMVSKVFKSTVNNLLFFFPQTQVFIFTFHIDHK